MSKDYTYGNWFPFWLDQRSILAVHLVVEPAGIAQIVSGGIPPPQGRRGGTTVDALSSFCKKGIK